MEIFVNERKTNLEPESTVESVIHKIKPNADVLVLNGFPTEKQAVLKEGDRLILIKRGEVPTPDELQTLIGARDTPGVRDKLRNASVGIAGAGGLGSAVAVSLARAGVGKLVIVDFDVVEPSNLNRQQYFIDQIGFFKVDALKANLARINPGVLVETRNERLTPDNFREIFESVTIIVEAFDRADQKAMLIETSARVFPQKPIVMGVGMAGYGATNLLKERILGNLYICGDESSGATSGMGLMAPRVGVVANMQANRVMEMLLGPDPQIPQGIG